MKAAHRSARAARGAGERRADPLAAPLTTLDGIGPARAEKLARLGLLSLRDLLLCVPRRLERFPARVAISAVRGENGPDFRVAGLVERRSFQRFGRRSLLRLELRDDSGSIPVLFFNQSWLRERFERGASLELLGRLVAIQGGRRAALVCRRIATEERPLPAPGELVPTYPACEGLSQEFLRATCRGVAERWAGALVERLDARALRELDLAPLPEAARELHAPTSEAAFARAARRVGFESLLALQARLTLRRRAIRRASAPRFEIDGTLHARLVGNLPFELTRGQHRVLDDLRADLARGTPMRRLLQGDVGAGKTALGLYACAAVASLGAQAAFMAPTELLAEQHFYGSAPLLRRAGFEPVLLTGSLAAAARRRALESLREGSAPIAFGTHALFGEDVRFARLGLAVIDEQHRFGVEQRARLAGKGLRTHVLLMTATPIPRSLALTTYGDLDLSVLKEKPPGRASIRTLWARDPERRRDAQRELSARLDAGEQAYWVVPRIGAATEGDARDALELERDDAAAALGAEERFARLAKGPYARHGIELVHGRMPAAERARRLDRFRRGEARLLVATTVIEVGVDVPAATVIVIEAAERLGLAQLHQLRGRVGRSSRPSACFVLGGRVAAERLELFERASDGFAIAEADLALRGMGDLAGLRQAGASLEDALAGEGALERIEFARRLLEGDARLLEVYGAASAGPDA